MRTIWLHGLDLRNRSDKTCYHYPRTYWTNYLALDSLLLDLLTGLLLGSLSPDFQTGSLELSFEYPSFSDWTYFSLPGPPLDPGRWTTFWTSTLDLAFFQWTSRTTATRPGLLNHSGLGCSAISVVECETLLACSGGLLTMDGLGLNVFPLRVANQGTGSVTITT